MERLKGRSYLTLRDYTEEEILHLLSLARDLRAKKRGSPYPAHLKGKLLEGRNIVLLFDKASTRTRCSFEVAAFDEGASVTYLTNSQMGKKESIEDTAKVLGRLYDSIEYRGFEQSIVEELARHSGVPVYNGLTDDDHPTQVLADVLTAVDHTGKQPRDLVFTYVGDGRNNVSNALAIGARQLGMEYRVAAPKALQPLDSEHVKVFEDPYEAVKGCDVIYTDVWVSMGEEAKMRERIGLLKEYQVTMDLLKASQNPGVLFEHCLPAFHDLETTIGMEVYEEFGLTAMEVTDEVFRSSRSVVFDQAENRMHTIKAIMVATLG
ncbi:MAG: ornithine carbamoyltransferase [Spirochaetales bacterium]|nr:ornithine carbamoyltransferase [Spirochaetales bacterium]